MRSRGRGRLVALLTLALLAGTSHGAAGALAAPATAATAPQPAARSSAAKPSAPASPARKVWTSADLDRLRAGGDRGVTLLPGDASPLAEPTVVEGVAGPQGVPARLQEMVSEAHANLARLERERLAVSNPLLRGLAAGQAIRPVADIDKDRMKWSERLRLAENALANAGGAAAAAPASAK